MCKSAEEAKANICCLLFLFIFRRTKISLTLEAHFDKSMTINGSNNAENRGSGVKMVTDPDLESKIWMLIDFGTDLES